MDKNEYEKLCREVLKHDRLYYVENAPRISDEEYDQLYKKIEAIEKAHPEWITPESPTQRIGEALTTGFRTIVHSVPMLSLANTYTTEEVEQFLKRMEKLTGHERLTYTTELKIDGVAISATYVNGIFRQGVTRGDGQKGDDITTNLRTIQMLPLRLVGEHAPDYLEVRGEVFMPHGEFERLNREKAKNGEPLWANPRNAAAGSLKLLDPKEAARRKLSCILYGIAVIKGHHITSQYKTHQYLKSLGLPILGHIALCHNKDEIFEYAEKIRNLRPKLPYDIDGVVIKLDNLQEQEKLGSSGKNPRLAVAYKFAAEQAETQVNDITVQVGRTGVLTPVAELEPVFLAGSTISRATLHNFEEAQRKDVRIGDTVIIEKGGDVIPKVVEVNKKLRPTHTKPWHAPTQCPACGTKVVKVEGEVAVRCPNTGGCPQQGLRRIIFFACRDAMDIENLGEKVAEQLFKKGFVTKPSDIYALNADQLAQLEGFKEKSISNLLNSIDASRKVPLSRFIMALGIKHIGSQTAELLAIKAHSLKHLAEMTKDQFMSIEGIGEKVACALEDYFKDPENRQEIARLLERGVKPEPLRESRFEGHQFNGKTFVLTGSLEKYTRTEAANLIKTRGGKVSDSVSKKTDYVVAGADPGSKLDKAHQLGILVLTEEKFEKML